jgi:pyruvate dehydrogenase E1 component beta subunit
MTGVAEAESLTVTYREACKQGIRAALASDPRVFLMGEDIGRSV